MKTLEALFEASKAVAKQGKPMSLRRATLTVIAISGLVVLYAAGGMHYILTGQKHLALLYCGLVTLMLITLPIHVYNFLRVKKGVRVVTPNPLPLFELLRIPLFVKVALAGSLTTLVAAMSYFSLSPLHFSYLRTALHNHIAFNFLMVTLGFNLFLWVIVAFTWYLFVLTHKQEPMNNKPSVEQGNDIWPPAPSMPDGRSKIDGNLQ